MGVVHLAGGFVGVVLHLHAHLAIGLTEGNTREGEAVDILSNINGQDVVIEVSDPSRAGVLVPAEQTETEELLMLLMPMMLND